MARELDTTYSASLPAQLIRPVRMVQLAFRSQTVYCWTGVGPLTWNGLTFLGIGSLGKISAVREGVGLQAGSVTLTLSAIDPLLFAECMADIRLGATVRIWRGNVDASGALIGTPYQLFRGQVDQPAISMGAQDMSIALTVESRIVNLQRASGRRYTAADQRLSYPTDMAFDWLEQLNDLALVWG